MERTSITRQGESLGSIYDVMIDKRSGGVAYAVMSFGGFLGMGEDYHPLPWSMLTYDTRQGGISSAWTRTVWKALPDTVKTTRLLGRTRITFAELMTSTRGRRYAVSSHRALTRGAKRPQARSSSPVASVSPAI